MFTPKWIQVDYEKLLTMTNAIVYGLNETKGEDARIKWSKFFQIFARIQLLEIVPDKNHEKRVLKAHQDNCWIFRSRCPGYQKCLKSADYQWVQFGLRLPGPNFGGAKSSQTARGPD